MKNFITLLASVLLLASCSAPKYSYYFDHYDYNSGKKKAQAENTALAANTVQVAPETEQGPLSLEEGTVVASAANDAAPVKSTAPVMEKVAAGKKYTELTKAEKKEFRKALKTEVKKYMKAKRSGDHGASTADTKALDYNLKMAIIFGAIALTLSFFGGVNSVFWVLSVVSLVIGVVFFVKWIAEQ